MKEHGGNLLSLPPLLRKKGAFNTPSTFHFPKGKRRLWFLFQNRRQH